MNNIIFLIALLWFSRIITNLLSYIHLWWVKEYRFDRMLIHLRTEQGKNILWLSFRKPPVTPKTVFLFLITLTTLTVLFFFLRIDLIFKIVTLDLLVFPLTWIWVGVLTIPTTISHARKIRLAAKKLLQYKHLIVIGITGSYGKTSTKEFLTTILSQQYQVLKTEASKNSLIGAAEVILTKLNPDHKVFVVEMGAYKRGEIAKICELVKPKIGVITSINSQHQDLFKTLDTTMKAKYELIKALPSDGVAIFNADDELVVKMAKKAHAEKRHVWVYTKNPNQNTGWTERQVKADQISAGLGNISFSLHIGKDQQNIEVPVLGAHQIQNILAAASAALSVGMKFQKIVVGIKMLRFVPGTMESIAGVNGAIYINDTFNNNPDAAKAALEYLALTSGRKILVFQPMVELGNYAQTAHQEIGSAAARICDEIFLTNRNWFEWFLKGVAEVDPGKQIKVLSASKIAQFIKRNIRKDDTVLFKGKEAAGALDILART